MLVSEFFSRSLSSSDPEVFQYIKSEESRQRDFLELIASENIVSPAILEAQGSVLTNKYAEGYPGKRYYNGCEFVDAVESVAIARAKKLFNAQHVNVQPHSGCQANQAVFLALLQPFDTFLSLSLDCGGHLSHGSKVSISGKWFNPVHYSVHHDTFLIDYEQAEELALQHKPKLIIAGYSAYPREVDFARFRRIADKVGAYLMVDMAHIAGLVAAKIFANPLEHAHVVTTTTHKTLRGPRGGMILTNDAALAKKIDSAVFPGLQGGPLMHVIAAKAVAFGEALREDYVAYIKQVIRNCQAMARVLTAKGGEVLTGGTDSHLLILNLSKLGVTGRDLTESIERAGLAANKNSIPFDKEKAMATSGVRLGSAACTTRGLVEKDFEAIAGWIMDLLDQIVHNSSDLPRKEAEIRSQVHDMCQRFPIY